MENNFKDGFPGLIFRYSKNLTAFDNGIRSDKTIVLLNGIYGSLTTLPYLPNFIIFCQKYKIRLVVPQLSSHPNFRIFPISQDVEDINLLLEMIDGDVVLIGQSTGCQDIMLYMEAHASKKVKGIVLQSPVSDIEHNDDETIKRNVKIAENFKETTTKYAEVDGILWLKERFISINVPNEEEDIFSSYLQESEFSKWKKFNMKILSVISGQDEFCKKSAVDKLKLFSEVKVIENADHRITNPQSREAFIEIVHNFLIKIDFI